MTDNILEFTGETVGRIEPDDILEGSVGYYEDVVLVGITKDGEIDVNFSNPCVGMAIYWLEKAKLDLLSGEDES